MKPFQNAAVAQAFEAYPPNVRPKLLALRELIFKVAASTPGICKLEKTLKWGEPAYLTLQTKSGSTVRIGWKSSSPTQYAMYFHCQTNLFDTFRILFPGESNSKATVPSFTSPTPCLLTRWHFASRPPSPTIATKARSEGA